jgi:hypothetical protein
MKLALTPELQTLIERHMKSGGYPTPEDAVAAALYSLDQAERSAFVPGALEQLLGEGESSGQALDGQDVLDELRRLRSRHGGGRRGNEVP